MCCKRIYFWIRLERLPGIWPGNLVESDKLPEPIFTPSTKAEIGHHDINIDFKETIEKIGKTLADRVKTLSLTIYKKGAEFAVEKGIGGIRRHKDILKN